MKTKSAFTLVELLTVIAIIGILAAIIIPTIGKVRKQAAIAKVTSNLRQTGILIMLSANDNRDELPGRNNGSAIGTGDKGLNAGASDRIGSGEYHMLGYHLASCSGLAINPSGNTNIPSLEDPLGRRDSKSPDGRPVLWILNRDMKGGAGFYPGIPGGTVIHPFGSNAGTGAPPMRYTALLGQIAPSRTWALIQADVKGASVDYSLSAGSAYNSPDDPVLGSYRLALFFDWSVGRIPTGTNLRKEISIRQ